MCAIAAEPSQAKARCGMAIAMPTRHDMVQGPGLFCHLSQLMTGVLEVLEVTAHDDGTYKSLIHESRSLPLLSSDLPHRKTTMSDMFHFRRLLVFYGTSRDKIHILASSLYSCANIPSHSLCYNQSSPRPGSYMHRNTESRPLKPSYPRVHLLR